MKFHSQRSPRTIIVLVVSIVIVHAAAGCASREYDPQVRRERLLAMYPPGQTSREDVQKKWGTIAPLTEVRPADGWMSSEDLRVRERTVASEQRTGKTVYRVDCYLAPDGLFGLCNNWFFYDARDILTDAEWQFHSD